MYTVVSNGIELKHFENPDRKRHEPTEILFAGRLVWQKNPLFALETFYEYLKIDPTAHLTVIGKGMMEAQVKDKINKLEMIEHVTCLSETDKMEEYYKNSDLYLFPSNYEGLGITLIEAQASGLKCLASDAVPSETQCGLVEYKAIRDGAFKWGIQYIPELLHANLTINKSALQYYDIRNTVKQMEKIYKYS